MRLLLTLLLLGLVGPSSCTKSERQTLVVTGSSTIAPLLTEIARRYEAAHPEVRIDVQSGGSGRGIADARSGVADIGMVSRELTEDEQDLHAVPLALDGICVILHAENPVRELDDAQVAAIYRGEIERWSEVGGADAPITVVHKAEGRSTLELFLAHFGLANPEVSPDVVIGDNEQGIKTLIGNPHAIAYVSIGTAEYDARHGAPIQLLPVGGVPATTQDLQSGRFPLARTLNLVTASAPEGLGAAFLEFASSAEVHDLVEAQCFVPLAR